MRGPPQTQPMTDVEIEYCVPCGFLNRASDLAETLLSTFGEDLDRVSLVTGDGGVFRVRVDGTTVFEKGEDEYDLDGVTRAVRAEL